MLSLVSCGKSTLKGVWVVKETAESEVSIFAEFSDNEMLFMDVLSQYHMNDESLIVTHEGKETTIAYELKGETLFLSINGVSIEFEKVHD